MNLILKYFPDLTEEQIRSFSALKEIYLDWNQKINVISRKDTDSFYEHHVLHSLGIAKLIQFKAGTTVLDVGTGGGFPGIPLAILFPGTNFHLVDSIGKKIKVVQAVAEELKLENVSAEHKRAEQLKGQYDFVISRAVTRLANFLPWVEGRIKKSSFNELSNGYLFLKGGDLDEEIEEVKAPIRIIALSDYFEEDFFLTKKVLYLPAFR